MQKKIEKIIPKDKLLHFCIGLLLSLLAIIWVWLIFIPIIVGVAKEILDKYVRKTGYNVKDMFATWLGIVPVLMILSIDAVL